MRLQHFMLVGLLSLSSTCYGDDASDLIAELRATADRTIKRLENETATWTAAHEFENGTAELDFEAAPNRQRWTLFIRDDEGRSKVHSVIQRDGAWYVRDDQTAVKCRPYTFIFPTSAVYFWLQRSFPIAVTTEHSDFGPLESLDDLRATYRAPFPPDQHATVLAAVRQFREFEARQGRDRVKAELRTQYAALEDALQRGVRTVIDRRTGLIIENGIPGKRIWIKNFEFQKQLPQSNFEIADVKWEDRSSPWDDQDFQHLVMLSHAPHWKPGAKTPDTDPVLFHLRTGRMLRVPFQGVGGMQGCFSADRRKVFVTGLSGLTGRLSLYEVDIQTGVNRQLGDESLDTGNCMFPSLAPDGKTLVVNHTTATLLQSQLVLVDLESGRCRRLGKPLDTAGATWLPSGQGLVLTQRTSLGGNQVPRSQIGIVDLTGRLTVLRDGDFPKPFGSKPQILFKVNAPEKQWKVCDIDGQNERVIADGLADFGFPAPSPDGKQAIMIKFGEPQGPRPYWVDLSTGSATALKVGPGLWAMPVWR